MKRSRLLSYFFVCMLLFPFLSFSQSDVLSRISNLEALLNNDITQWKLITEDLAQAENPELDDSSWEVRGHSFSVRNKISWIRHSLKVPEVFSGIRTDGSPAHLVCHFRGVGQVEGKFYLDGELSQSFLLEFGNHVTEIDKSFLLKSQVKPGENIFFAFRFNNRGRIPLIERKTSEPGTFIQLLNAQFIIDNTQTAHRQLSQFLLDLKIGAIILDITPSTQASTTKSRPQAKAYQQFLTSKSYKRLKQTFEKALMNVDILALQKGDFTKVKASILKFYQEAKPVVRFANSYTLFLGGNSHIDLAWLWRWMETVEVSKETFSTILDNMEEYPDIIYIQSQAQAYKWMEDYYPEVFKRIQKKVKEGRWEIVGGMWAEPDCNLIDGESFIRQILYGKRYFKEKFNVDVKIGWNPDSFGYNWNMPQFFKKSGINTFVTQKISWNDTTVFPYFFFWWQGPDGSRLLSYFPPTGYVGTLRAKSMASGMKQFEKNTGLKKIFILYGLGNHGGGPNREMLDRAKGYADQLIFPKMVHSSFSHYLDKINKGELKTLPVWEDELYLEYHRGTYTTQAETKKLNRKSEVLLANSEKISSLAFLYGRDYPHLPLKSAWEKVLMNQFHDILPGSSINPVYRDAKEFYRDSSRLAKNELLESMNFLAKSINTLQGEEGIPLVVFNTLSWERNDVVKVALPSKLKGKPLVVSHAGEETPSQIITTPKGQILCFIAKGVPPLGYKVYKIKEGEASPPKNNSLQVDKTSLENRFFRITLHPESGNIISIFDKKAKREILAPNSQGNELQLLEDIPDRWDAWNIQYTGRKWTLDNFDSIKIAQKGPIMASLKVEKSYLGLSKARREPTTDFPSSFFSQEIILYNDVPRIDIEMNVDWWEDHVLLKVAFPVDVKNDWATYEIPFAFIQRPTTQNTDWEKARFEVPAIRWADLSDGAYGVSLLNESKYGYDIKDNVMRLTLLRSPLSPDPMADRGKHSFSYSLYPHEGNWKEAHTVQKGYEFNVPLLAFFQEEHKGVLPPSLSFFHVVPSNIILASIKKAEDRSTIILRIYEAEGKDTEACLEFFRTPKKIYELDLMEQRLRTISFNDKSATLHFGKSEIKTIEIEF